MARLYTDGIKDEDVQLAIGIRNHLRNGRRVIGNPGLGLKKTLRTLEDQLNNIEYSKTDWAMKNPELIAKIAMTKAGIEGEQKLCEYLSILVKYDDSLDGLVCFASLSYEQDENDKDYIPDTDTLLVYGNHVLVVDAKNLKVKSTEVYQMIDGTIVNDKGKPLIHVNPSTHIWEKVFEKAGIPIESIDGYVCVVGDIPMKIERDDEWYESHTKLIHISELQTILHEWIEDKDNALHLNMLTEIAKAQIREEKTLSFNPDEIRKRFGV